MTGGEQAPTKLGALAELVGGQVRGNADLLIPGVAALDRAGPTEISFLANPKFRGQLDGTRAAAVIVHPSLDGKCDRPLLLCANPYLAFAALLMAGIDGIENKIDPGGPLDKDIYDLAPEELKNVPSLPGSLEEALRSLERDHDFLLKGDRGPAGGGRPGARRPGRRARRPADVRGPRAGEQSLPGMAQE